jgi:DNA adenine methylase
VRAWLSGLAKKPRLKPRLLVEPFAGGGIVSLTAVMEGLVDQCVMVELDHDVAAFWRATLDHGQKLVEKLLCFQPTSEAVSLLMKGEPRDPLERGFRTLVLNRTRRGGILAPGASFIKEGEQGKGLVSRWYPKTIANRLTAIGKVSDRIDFREMDGVEFLAGSVTELSEDVAYFLDPPYTAGGKRAGRRLYVHNEIDHALLFEILSRSSADFLMTYDYSTEVVELVNKHHFHAVQVLMKNAHHITIPELVITRRPTFELTKPCE